MTIPPPFNSILERGRKGGGIATLIFRYFSSTSTEQIFPDSAEPFTSFDPLALLFSLLPPLATNARSFTRLRADGATKGKGPAG
jgi:hypothetical protein